MKKLREAYLNGIKCNGLAEQINEPFNTYWVAFVKIDNGKFVPKKEYLFEGYLKVNDELKHFEALMFGGLPKVDEEVTTLKLVRHEIPGLEKSKIKDID